MAKGNKRRSKTREWAKMQDADPYTKRARSEGYASRAVYKLEEIDKQDRLLKAGAKVVDLGAAPGGWSQYCAQKVGETGQVIAVDLLPVDLADTPGCTVIIGDIRESSTMEAVISALSGEKADLVISDMAPNITGVVVTDEARFEGLLDVIRDTLPTLLRPGGKLVVKLFEGRAAQGFRGQMKREFARATVRKPKSSRPGSREFYIVYVGYRGAPNR